jgi:hypothetical protein
MTQNIVVVAIVVVKKKQHIEVEGIRYLFIARVVAMDGRRQKTDSEQHVKLISMEADVCHKLPYRINCNFSLAATHF